nr:MAG TPA: Rad50 zinc hook motif [Caudoviricetes sp.]
MCEFCDKYHSQKGMITGKEIEINKCVIETDLKDCQIYIYGEDNPSIIIWGKNGIAIGYFEIAFCPICGRKLVEE